MSSSSLSGARLGRLVSVAAFAGVLASTLVGTLIWVEPSAADHIESSDQEQYWKDQSASGNISLIEILGQVLGGTGATGNGGTESTGTNGSTAPQQPAERADIPGYELGGDIASKLDRSDRTRLAELTIAALNTGEPQSYFNIESGVLTSARVDTSYESGRPSSSSNTQASSGSSATINNEIWNQDTNLPPLTQVPALDRIDAWYRTSRRMRVRGGPGRHYAPVATLDQAESVHVVGRVSDTEWVLISSEGRGVGFVFGRFLEAADYQAVRWIPGNSETRTPTTRRNADRSTTREQCRRVIQEAVLRRGGRSMANPVFCRRANGHWERA